MEMRDAALELIEKGARIFPCRPLSKKPAVDHWKEWSTTDRVKADTWWRNRPLDNIAIDCRGLLVVDCDLKPGIDGRWNYVNWLGSKGLGNRPDTLLVNTPSGGTHVYYRNDDSKVANSVGKLAPGVDIRSEGGYIIAPGSQLSNGKYEILYGQFDQLSRPPLELLRALRTPDPAEVPPVKIRGNGTTWGKAAMRREIDALRLVPQGGRNHALNRAAFKLGQLTAVGYLDRDDVADQLELVGRSMGLTQVECWHTIESGLRGGEMNPRPITPVPDLPRGPSSPSFG